MFGMLQFRKPFLQVHGVGLEDVDRLFVKLTLRTNNSELLVYLEQSIRGVRTPWKKNYAAAQ